MGDEFNKELWEERHETNESEHSTLFDRLRSVETRFLVIMTSLVLTLIGVVANLVLQLAKNTGG